MPFKRLVALLCFVVLSGCASMRDVGIGMQTGAAGAAANGSGGVIVAPVLWVTGVALELIGDSKALEPSTTDDQSHRVAEVSSELP